MRLFVLFIRKRGAPPAVLDCRSDLSISVQSAASVSSAAIASNCIWPLTDSPGLHEGKIPFPLDWARPGGISEELRQGAK